MANSKNIRHLAVDDDEFYCPMCCDVFEEPKLLPNCAHSFCKTCLRELVQRLSSSFVSCPVCRKTSKLPRNGVDGFATNTLLVRLIDNIPGKKDKDALSKAVAHCKDEMKKSKEIQDELEKKFNEIDRNKDKGERVKREISQHAKSATDAIRQSEQTLCKLVDAFLEFNCGSAFHERLQKHRGKYQNHMAQAAACINTVEETLASNDTEEIVHMKKMMTEQLNECSSFPSCPLLKEVGSIKDFNMEFTKFEIVKQELGKVEEIVQVCKEEPGSNAGNHSRTNCSGSSKSNQSDGSVGKIITEVTLAFDPFRMAICPDTGDIALLCKENRKVYLLDSNGHHNSTISIKYGDLWDVGFAIDDKVVVINRDLNRLLYYEKDGIFINIEVEPPRDSLKYTYMSVDEAGRLIVTSTKTDYDDEDDIIIPCVVVYNNGCEASCRMFGRRHLVKPISRAVYLDGQYYIADRQGSDTYIHIFSFQGACNHSIAMCKTMGASLSLSVLENSDYLFIVQHSSKSSWIRRMKNVDVKTRKVHLNYNNTCDLRQAVVISNQLNGCTMQAEIYEHLKIMIIVRYFA